MFPGLNILSAAMNRLGKQQASFKWNCEMTRGRLCFAVAVEDVDVMSGCIETSGFCFSRVANASLRNHLWEDEASSSSSAVWNLLVLRNPGNFYPYLPIPAQSRGQ